MEELKEEALLDPALLPLLALTSCAFRHHLCDMRAVSIPCSLLSVSPWAEPFNKRILLARS